MFVKTKNIISITEARSNIFDIAEKIQKEGNHYIFTENGKAKMAVMSAEEYDSLIEDLMMANDKRFVVRMKRANVEFKQNELVSWNEVKNKLAIKHGSFVFTDKSSKKCLVKKSKKHNK
ncbi:MAG: type II toxin-antitoxin system Phd/YefM family antitoxin [Candidatus Paceibacterota bacterium]|jgi:prevent-host-death family protein